MTKLIVGLGNPGKQYENTRHNVGFIAIDNYATKENLDFKEKFNGLYSDTIINNEKVIFLKPLSYMNDSGIVIRKYVDYFNISKENIFIIYDDISFDISNFKIKKSGSSAGHNGIKSIIENLGTEDFSRLKIGIGKPNIEMKNFVLSKFNQEERENLNKVINLSYEIIKDFCNIDIEKLMSKYNS